MTDASTPSPVQAGGTPSPVQAGGTPSSAMAGDALREGGLRAPVRHPYAWRGLGYTDANALETELERVFDVCHGCRRCLALCDSFPRLFDMIDESPSGELDTTDKSRFSEVVDACTLCDMCFMASCPYVPPHEFDIDFPRLMTRARVADKAARRKEPKGRALTAVDRNARFARLAPWLVNWASARGNRLTRPLLRLVFGIHPDAELPAYARTAFTPAAAKRDYGTLATPAPAHAPAAPAPAPLRKAVVYSTCFVHNHDVEVGHAAMALLAANGVSAQAAYPGCCGMPRLERGDLVAVARAAKKVAAAFESWIDDGHDVIVLTPSCALMLKFEWPQLLPENEQVKRLAAATYDISEYLVELHRRVGLAVKPKPLEGGIFLHVACHARAQNIGFRSRDLLKLIPGTELKFAARCSGHGGLWGALEENFETAHKVGKPVARQIQREGLRHFASECPLAGRHLAHGVERLKDDGVARLEGEARLKDGAKDSEGCAKCPGDGAEAAEPCKAEHPIVLFARACGLTP